MALTKETNPHIITIVSQRAHNRCGCATVINDKSLDISNEYTYPTINVPTRYMNNTVNTCSIEATLPPTVGHVGNEMK